MDVKTAEPENNLGKYLRRGRAGETVIVYDRNQPVAEQHSAAAWLDLPSSAEYPGLLSLNQHHRPRRRPERLATLIAPRLP